MNSYHNDSSSNIYSNSKIYEPTSVHCLNTHPIISVATLYNYYKKGDDNDSNMNSVINKGNKVVFNVIDLAQEEFFNMFYYTTAKYFCVNKANTSNKSIVLGSQTYVANDSRVHVFSLYNEIIKSFEQNYNISANNINPAALISLQREVYNTQSLASICGNQLGLSWDQVIANLISNGQIEHGCDKSVAIIIFQVNLNYHSSALNVDLTTTFQYKVPITGYVLKYVVPEPIAIIPEPVTIIPEPYSGAEEVIPYSGAEEMIPYSGAEEMIPYSGAEDVIAYSGAEDVIAYSGAEEVIAYSGAEEVIAYSGAEEKFSSSIKKYKESHKKSSKKTKFNIQSLANKLKDIEDLILDVDDNDFEFNEVNKQNYYPATDDDSD